MGDARADGIKARFEELIEELERGFGASGPKAVRAADQAIRKLHEGLMWAVKAFGAEDFVAGDEAIDP